MDEDLTFFERVAPLSGHDKNSVLMEFGSNQRVHLCHVTTQPAKKKENGESLVKLFFGNGSMKKVQQDV